jgi:DNA topoisomerase-3
LYTMATLLTDLTRVSKYIRNDRLRKLLLEKDKGKEGEHGGIGTPATRHSIIATLFERSYLVEQPKSSAPTKKTEEFYIVPSQTAEEFYDALPDQARFPVVARAAKGDPVRQA